MTKEKLAHVLELIDAEKTNEAQNLFNTIVPKESIDYLLVKGKLNQKFQNWGDAINAFSAIIEINPENLEAKNSLQMIQNILNFWNPEMFNP